MSSSNFCRSLICDEIASCRQVVLTTTGKKRQPCESLCSEKDYLKGRGQKGRRGQDRQIWKEGGDGKGADKGICCPGPSGPHLSPLQPVYFNGPATLLRMRETYKLHMEIHKRVYILFQSALENTGHDRYTK